MATTRKIPMRMCIGCRERRPKRELIRIVRTPNDDIQLDRTGKLSGRGAYLCADRSECLKRAVRSKALERALERPVTEEIYEALNQQMGEQA